MATLEQQLIDIIRQPVELLGLELVGIEMIRARIITLRVYIDKDGGVTVDDCAEASYQISAVMDVEDPIKTRYQLEVSSPGLDRPLFSLVDYQRFIGSDIQLTLRVATENRRKWKGTIQEVNGSLITLVVADEKNAMFAFENIQKANIIPKF